MRVTVFIPCLNEEKAIGRLIADFRHELPQAELVVFDNLSVDHTASEAREAGAEVISSGRPGKGFVVRHAFEVLDADVLVMIDGDGTYYAADAARVIEPVLRGRADMVVGTRLQKFADGSFRPLHLFGNHFFSRLVSRVFQCPVNDMLSGYRAFSREFYRTIPLSSQGFEIETELTLQAISKGFTVTEVPVTYGERLEGSFSKLHTFSDGFKISKLILLLARAYRPLPFFGGLAALFTLFSLISGWAPVRDYVEYQYVYTVPRAILACGLGLLAVVLLGVGLILDGQIRLHNENFELQRKLARAGGRRREDAPAAASKPKLVA